MSLPTMKAVAEEAGVSLGTVSNCLNQPDRVTAGTRARVKDAIERLGYIRNAAARDLKRQGSDGIGLIVPDIVNRLFVEIARGSQAAARRSRQSLVMANAVYTFQSFSPLEINDQQDQFLDFFAEQRMAGILYAAMSDPADQIARIRGHVQPIVVINHDGPGDWCSVLMDNYQAGCLATEHLADSGVRHVYFLSPPDVAQPIAERRRGLTDAGRRRGIRVTEVVTDGLWLQDGRDAAVQVMGLRNRHERIAIVGVTDELALGAIQIFRGLEGVRIPRDVCVMGLDGSHDGAASDWIPLTSIVVPGYRMGEEAVRLVQDEGTHGHCHQRLVLPVTIRQGRSTAGR